MSIESELARLSLRLANVRWSFSSEFAMRHFIKHRRPRMERTPYHHFPPHFSVNLTEMAGFPVYRIQPHAQTPVKHVLFLHGGAYVSPMKGLHWDFLKRLTKQMPCAVTVPLYGLAPKYNYKNAFPLLDVVYRALLKTTAPEDVIIIGDSSGGGLALAFAQQLRDAGLPQPAGLVLMSPWLDIRLCNPAIGDVQPRDPILAVPGNQEAGRMWADGADPSIPVLSPINGSLRALAPICVLMGSDDILMPDARLLRDKAEAEGQPLRYLEYPSMFHIWMLAPIPEGRRALQDIVAFIKDLSALEVAPRIAS